MGFSFIGLASIVNVFMMDYVLDIIGFDGFCYAYSSLTGVALLILVFIFEEKKAFDDDDKKIQRTLICARPYDIHSRHNPST